jgi:hypothetical protein
MFKLFREVWHGNLPMDLLWRRTRYQAMRLPPSPASLPVPDDFIAVKLYAGPALSMSDQTRDALRHLVAGIAATTPVVLLDVDLGIDEHRDLELDHLPGVTSARSLMDARTNLAVQLSIIARSRFFLSTCGGLAWLAPFLGVPTVAVYDTDHLLAPHLLVARQAAARTGAADFNPLDLRGLTRVGLDGVKPA